MKLPVNKDLKKLQGWRDGSLLRALAAFPEDLGLVSRIYKVAQNHL